MTWPEYQRYVEERDRVVGVDMINQEPPQLVRAPTASEITELQEIIHQNEQFVAPNLQEALNAQATEQVRDSLMGDIPITDIEYARMRHEAEAVIINAQRQQQANEPVYLDSINSIEPIHDGMSMAEYSARRRAGETFERPMTARDIERASRELSHVSRMSRRRQAEQQKEKEMANKDVTVMNIMDMYATDMHEKYHRVSMSNRNPLHKFKDAVTVVNRAQGSRAGSSTETKDFLSPNIANLTLSSTDVLPFKEFCEITGVNYDRVNRNLRRLRERGLSVVFIGYGGMSINMLHFMETLKRQQTSTRLFRLLSIYEPDKLSLTNMFRVYKDCSKINGSIEQSQYKTNLFTERGIADETNIVNEYFTERDARNWSDTTIFIGAPDFGTREILKDRRFFFVGHGDNEISITYQPSTEHDMTIETYGKIDVRILWSNLLSATEAMIEILANTDFRELKPNTEMFVNNAFEMKNSNKQRATSSNQHSF